ncbi:hypothetical protein HHL11_19855 [Ramlibacter sp. G-1-2-2]|uniref:Uncharacterized protein n=1 Tax=Ramlibacter agri TaxID=2728837 RepID=A0A848HBY5_9BURK|nr:hypothetical protein [Ramlibacter agri]NML46013.1 hypothetical protein [Ramlibacter agri]
MQTLFGILLRVVLFAVGLVLAASFAVAFVLVLAVWALRTAWLCLTGRPAAPFVMRFRAADGFRRAYRGSAQPARRSPEADVTDVEAKRIIPR